MTKQEHIKRHSELHRALDELLADFIGSTGFLPSQSTIMDLVEWSYRQTTEPDEPKRRHM
jgi:hypothetical protein